jgi:hypothetical protein
MLDFLRRGVLVPNAVALIASQPPLTRKDRPGDAGAAARPLARATQDFGVLQAPYSLSFSTKTLNRTAVRLTKMWGRVWGRL